MANEQAPSPERLPVVRAAVKKGCHPHTVDRLIRDGRLSVEWHLGRRLVDPEELERLIRQPPQRPR